MSALATSSARPTAEGSEKGEDQESHGLLLILLVLCFFLLLLLVVVSEATRKERR